MQHVLQYKLYFLKIQFLLTVHLFVVVMRCNGSLILSFSLVFPAGEIQTALHISCSLFLMEDHPFRTLFESRYLRSVILIQQL